MPFRVLLWTSADQGSAVTALPLCPHHTALTLLSAQLVMCVECLAFAFLSHLTFCPSLPCLCPRRLIHRICLKGLAS